MKQKQTDLTTEHKIAAYKETLGLLKIGIQGIIYINGLAVIAYLAFLGSIVKAHAAIDLGFAVSAFICFAFGLISGVISAFCGNKSQYWYWKEKSSPHQKWQTGCVASVCAGIALFVLGSCLFAAILLKIISNI